MTPRKLYPGQTLTASEQNALVTKVMRMDRVSSAGLTSTVKDNGETRLRDNRLDIIQARITGAPTGAAYPYIEVAPNDDGTYTDAGPPFGREGTTTDLPAYERAGRTDVPTGAIVELTPLPDGGGWAFSWGRSGAPLATRNVNGTAVLSTTTDLRVDQATGVILATVSGYQVLSGVVATATVQGVVSTTAQTFGGRKTSNDSGGSPGGWWVTSTNTGFGTTRTYYNATETNTALSLTGVVSVGLRPMAASGAPSPVVTPQIAPQIAGGSSAIVYVGLYTITTGGDVVSAQVVTAGLPAVGSIPTSPQGFGVVRPVGSDNVLLPGIDKVVSFVVSGVTHTFTFTGGILTAYTAV
jgi:hypothetical protein